MKANDLLDLIGEASDEHIRDANAVKRKRVPRWAKWSSAAAACLCILIGGGIYVFGHMGANAGGGGDSDLSYMYYAGPVLPLTVRGESEGITARRNVNFDFSPYTPQTYSYEDADGVHTYEELRAESVVTDTYTLTNESDAARTVSLLYPFVGNMRGRERYPRLTVDGVSVEAELYPGPYSGGFEGAWGAPDQETGSVNSKALDCFEDYATLLSGGGYLSAALDEFPALDQPVTVYRLHDFVYSAVTGDVNPSLSMEFTIDPDKTLVFSFGMNGMSYDRDTGFCARRKGDIQYHPNADPARQHPEDGYVILLGEDISEYTLQGYRDMGCEDGEELSDLGCTVTRYETTFGEILRQLMAEDMGEFMGIRESLESSPADPAMAPSFELCYGLAAELLTTYGPLGDAQAERYSGGMLEDIFSAVYNDSRVIYLSFDVTVPAGGSVTVEAVSRKEASRDYVGKDKDKEGYGMATRLGSDITFTEQSASISSFDRLEIVSQNFGFDPLNGVTEVELDLSEAHYWMEVRTLSEGE